MASCFNLKNLLLAFIFISSTSLFGQSLQRRLIDELVYRYHVTIDPARARQEDGGMVENLNRRERDLIPFNDLFQRDSAGQHQILSVYPTRSQRWSEVRAVLDESGLPSDPDDLATRDESTWLHYLAMRDFGLNWQGGEVFNYMVQQDPCALFRKNVGGNRPIDLVDWLMERRTGELGVTDTLDDFPPSYETRNYLCEAMRENLRSCHGDFAQDVNYDFTFVEGCEFNRAIYFWERIHHVIHRFAPSGRWGEAIDMVRQHLDFVEFISEENINDELIHLYISNFENKGDVGQTWAHLMAQHNYASAGQDAQDLFDLLVGFNPCALFFKAKSNQLLPIQIGSVNDSTRTALCAAMETYKTSCDRSSNHYAWCDVRLEGNCSRGSNNWCVNQNRLDQFGRATVEDDGERVPVARCKICDTDQSFCHECEGDLCSVTCGDTSGFSVGDDTRLANLQCVLGNEEIRHFPNNDLGYAVGCAVRPEGGDVVIDEPELPLIDQFDPKIVHYLAHSSDRWAWLEKYLNGEVNVIVEGGDPASLGSRAEYVDAQGERIVDFGGVVYQGDGGRNWAHKMVYHDFMRRHGGQNLFDRLVTANPCALLTPSSSGRLPVQSTGVDDVHRYVCLKMDEVAASCPNNNDMCEWCSDVLGRERCPLAPCEAAKCCGEQGFDASVSGCAAQECDPVLCPCSVDECCDRGILNLNKQGCRSNECDHSNTRCPEGAMWNMIFQWTQRGDMRPFAQHTILNATEVYRDSSNKTWAHNMAHHNQVSHEVFASLVAANPCALFVRANNGKLPFEILVEREYSVESQQILCDAMRNAHSACDPGQSGLEACNSQNQFKGCLDIPKSVSWQNDTCDLQLNREEGVDAGEAPSQAPVPVAATVQGGTGQSGADVPCGEDGAVNNPGECANNLASDDEAANNPAGVLQGLQGQI